MNERHSYENEALYRYRDADTVTGNAVALLRYGYDRHPLHKQPEKPGWKGTLK